MDEPFDGYEDNEIISDSLTLETEAEIRQRLDSFYSANSARSTYFSTASISSYHSIDEPDNGDVGKFLILICIAITWISRRDISLFHFIQRTVASSLYLYQYICLYRFRAFDIIIELDKGIVLAVNSTNL